MRNTSLLVLSAVALAGCGLVAGFGPERELAAPGGGGSGVGGIGVGAGGIGGADAHGGMGGGGGQALLPHFCDPHGEVVWLRTFGDASYDELYRVAPAPADGIYATGAFEGAIELDDEAFVSEGARAFSAARLDSDGGVVWAHRYGKDLSDGGTPQVARHPDGVVLFGNTEHPLDVGGGEHTPFGGRDAFVTFLWPDGAHRWTTWLGGAGSAYALHLTVDPATNDVIVFGAFDGQLQTGSQLHDSAGDNDVMIVRLDGDDGTVLDSVSFGGPLGDWARGLAVAPDGRILLSGSTEGPVDFGDGLQPNAGTDGFAAVLTPELEVVWARQYDFPGNEHFMEVALSPNGMVAVGKIFAGSVDVGQGLQGDYLGAAFLMRLSLVDGGILGGTVIEGFRNPYALAVDTVGDITVAGEYRGTLTLGGEQFQSVGGFGDPLVFKVDPQFDVTWRHVVAGSYQSEAFVDVMIDGANDVVVAGQFKGELPLEGCGVRQSAGDADAVLFKRKK